MTADYLLCGLRCTSDLELTGLLPWTGGDHPIDFEIRVGTVPDQLDDTVYAGPLLQVSEERCRFALAGVARYLAENGRLITVQPEAGANAADIRLFLLGTMIGFLCHQRGLLPLQAGCVEIGDSAVAFTGASGAGKSTLAAAFVRRGYRLLADDLTVVDVVAKGGPLALPTFPRVKLWRDSLEGLGWDATGRERVRAVLEKFELPVEAAFRSEPLRLAAIYHLVRVDEPEEAGFSPLRGPDALRALLGGVYRQHRTLRMGYRDSLIRSSLKMAPVPNFNLSRMFDLAVVDATVDTIAARHAQ